MTAMPDRDDAIQRLELAGADPKLAAAIASVLPTAATPTATSTAIAVIRVAIPTVVVPLLVVITGWVTVDELRQIRNGLTHPRDMQ